MHRQVHQRVFVRQHLHRLAGHHPRRGPRPHVRQVAHAQPAPAQLPQPHVQLHRARVIGIVQIAVPMIAVVAPQRRQVLLDPLVLGRQRPEARRAQRLVPGHGPLGRHQEILVRHEALGRVGVQPLDQRPALQHQVRHLRGAQQLVHIQQLAADAAVAHLVIGVGLGQPRARLIRHQVQHARLPPGVIQQRRNGVRVGVAQQRRPVHAARASQRRPRRSRRGVKTQRADEQPRLKANQSS